MSGMGRGRGHPLMRAKRQAITTEAGSPTVPPKEPQRELTSEEKEAAKRLEKRFSDMAQFGRIVELEAKVELMENHLVEKEEAIRAANLEAKECRLRAQKAEEDLLQLKVSIPRRRTQEDLANRFQEFFKGTPNGYSWLKVGFKGQEEELEKFRTATAEIAEKEKMYQAKIEDLQEMVKWEQGKNKELASIKDKLQKDLLFERNVNKTYADLMKAISSSAEDFRLIEESKKLLEERKINPPCRRYLGVRKWGSVTSVGGDSSKGVDASSTGTGVGMSEEELEEER